MKVFKLLFSVDFVGQNIKVLKILLFKWLFDYKLKEKIQHMNESIKGK